MSPGVKERVALGARYGSIIPLLGGQGNPVLVDHTAAAATARTDAHVAHALRTVETLASIEVIDVLTLVSRPFFKVCKHHNYICKNTTGRLKT